MTSGGRPGVRASVALAGLAALAYVLLSSSAPGWGDAADLARSAVAEPLRPYGRAYPLQCALVRLVDAVMGDPARSATIVTALCGGAGVGLVHWICRRYLATGQIAALGAAGAWAVHHAYWSSSVDGEAYTLLGVFALAGIAALLASAEGVAGAWTCGLIVGLMPLHHRAALFLAPVLLAGPVVLAPAGERVRAGVRTLLGAALGVVPFVVLVFVEASRASRPFDAELLTGVLVGTPRNAALLLSSERPLLPSLAYVARWTLFCFPGPLLVLAVPGAVRLWHTHRRVAVLLAAMGALALVLPVRFDAVGDRHVFLVAAHPVALVAAAVGLDAVPLSGRRRCAAALAVLCVVLPPAVYATLAATDLGRRALPGLTADAARGVLLPVRAGDPGSAAWVHAVAPEVAARRRVYAEWGAAGALDYARVCGGLLEGVEVVRRMPSADEVRAAGEAGVLVALTPLWADEARRLAPLAGRAVRVAPSLYRVLPPE